MDAIYRHGLVAGNICLEITERLLMNDAVRISRMIAYLRRHGIAVALDDFWRQFIQFALFTYAVI